MTDRSYTIECRCAGDTWRVWEDDICTIREAREKVERRKKLTSGYEYRILLNLTTQEEVL
jgi:hypothetical protein